MILWEQEFIVKVLSTEPLGLYTVERKFGELAESKDIVFRVDENNAKAHYPEGWSAVLDRWGLEPDDALPLSEEGARAMLLLLRDIPTREEDGMQVLDGPFFQFGEGDSVEDVWDWIEWTFGVILGEIWTEGEDDTAGS